jgi:alkylation response protein AidB-like acyl-CoA dehydrogenase
MRFALSEEATALRDAVRELLERECPPAVVRAAWPGEDRTPVEAVWHKLADVGVLGVLVPEADGGLGLDETYLVPVLEEAGRAGLPAPLVETAAVAAPLLAAAGAHPALLGAVIAGEVTVACSLDGSGLAPYGQVADLLLVAEPGEAGGAGGPARLLRRAEAGAVPVDTIDGARALARLAASPGAGQVLSGGPAAFALAIERGTLGTAAQLVGLARRMLEMTVSYVKEREQFGVPIGSFQAVKHHLADALLAVEFAAPAVYRAAYSLASGAATASRDVSMAKAMASDAACDVARITIQCHGAIAYTTEYDHHLFSKRAWALAASWGSARWHRGQLATVLGLPADGPEGARR